MKNFCDDYIYVSIMIYKIIFINPIVIETNQYEDLPPLYY